MKGVILQKVPSSCKDTQKDQNPTPQAGKNCIIVASTVNDMNIFMYYRVY